MVNVARSWETAVARAAGLEGICLGVLPCMVAKLLACGIAIEEALDVENRPNGAFFSERARIGMLKS